MRTGDGLKRSAFALALTALLSVGAEAGKYCGDPVESGISAGATQEEALVAAQKWWSSRAGSLGRGYQNWDNANDQTMECSKDAEGTHHCTVTGRPCLPEGTLPDNVPKIEM